MFKMVTVQGKGNWKAQWRNSVLIKWLSLVLIILAIYVPLSIYLSYESKNVPPNPFEAIRIVDANAKVTGYGTESERLTITLKYVNVGGSDANVTGIFIDNKTLSSYPTFIDAYDTNGSSIKNLLGVRGFVIPVGEEGQIVMIFMRGSFASSQFIDIGLDTAASVNYLYSASCKIP